MRCNNCHEEILKGTQETKWTSYPCCIKCFEKSCETHKRYAEVSK